MFRGNHPAKVDEKGRLKLPAAFKQLVTCVRDTGQASNERLEIEVKIESLAPRVNTLDTAPLLRDLKAMKAENDRLQQQQQQQQKQ